MRLSMSVFCRAFVGVALLGAMGCGNGAVESTPFPASSETPAVVETTETPAESASPAQTASPDVAASPDKVASPEANALPEQAAPPKQPEDKAGKDALNAAPGAKLPMESEVLVSVSLDKVEIANPQVPLAKKLVFKVTNNLKTKCTFRVEGIAGMVLPDIASGATVSLEMKNPGPGLLSMTVDQVKKKKTASIQIVGRK